MTALFFNENRFYGTKNAAVYPLSNEDFICGQVVIAVQAMAELAEEATYHRFVLENSMHPVLPELVGVDFAEPPQSYVLAEYQGAIEAVLMLADLGPSKAEHLIDEAVPRENLWEVITELCRVKLITMIQGKVWLTQSGYDLAERLYQLAKSERK